MIPGFRCVVLGNHVMVSCESVICLVKSLLSVAY